MAAFVGGYIGAMDSPQPERPAVPRMPERPDAPDSGAEKQRGCMSILLASLSGIILLSLFMLLAMPFGKVGLVVVGIIGGVFLIAFLHYVTWGWWLGQLIRREEENSQDDE